MYKLVFDVLKVLSFLKYYILIQMSAVFQGDCWICMELMSTSLDKFYKYVYGESDDVIPEEILGKITLAVSQHFSN